MAGVSLTAPSTPRLRAGPGRGHPHDFPAAEAGPPQAEPFRIDLRPRPEVRQCRIDVVTLAAHRNALTRLSFGCTGIAVVEGQHGDSSGREVLFVLCEHHVVRRAEAVHQHNGRMVTTRSAICAPLTAATAVAGAQLAMDVTPRDGQRQPS